MTNERECYQCGKKKTALSHRSRCLTCENQRAEFNEHENDDLKGEMGQLQARNAELEQQNRELLAHVDRITYEISVIANESVGVVGWHLNGDIATWEELGVIALLTESPAQSLQLLTEKERENVAYEAVSTLKFPTMLRKMWSGGEVQEWLEEAARGYAKRHEK